MALSTITYNDHGVIRPIMYRLFLAEMIVLYGAPEYPACSEDPPISPKNMAIVLSARISHPIPESPIRGTRCPDSTNLRIAPILDDQLVDLLTCTKPSMISCVLHNISSQFNDTLLSHMVTYKLEMNDRDWPLP